MYVIEKNGNMLFEDDKFWVFHPTKKVKTYKNLKSAKRKACQRCCNVLDIPTGFYIDKSGKIYDKDMKEKSSDDFVVFNYKEALCDMP